MTSGMIGRFQFNGIESDIYKLVCKSVNRPLLPPAKVNRLELPGSSGAYDYPGNDYGLRTITMRIVYLGDDYNELRSRARNIAAWLSTNAWANLIIHDEPGVRYLARITEEIKLSSIWEAGSAEVVFDCQPFAYAVAESSVAIDVTEPGLVTFTNPGTRAINYKSPYGSKFIIQVEGTWDTLTLALNGKTLTYNEPNSTEIAIFDNIQMEFKLDGENTFFDLGGDIDTFLEILPGVNNLAIGGTGLGFGVLGHIKYIPMWI